MKHLFVASVFACLSVCRLPLFLFTSRIKERECCSAHSANLSNSVLFFQRAMSLMCVVLLAGCVDLDASLSRDHQQTGHHQYRYRNQKLIRYRVFQRAPPPRPSVFDLCSDSLLGTIGHVAHGKSTVVKAISGVHTVRFKNELERNITIKLGYANAKVSGTRDRFFYLTSACFSILKGNAIFQS